MPRQDDSVCEAHFPWVKLLFRLAYFQLALLVVSVGLCRPANAEDVPARLAPLKTRPRAGDAEARFADAERRMRELEAIRLLAEEARAADLVIVESESDELSGTNRGFVVRAFDQALFGGKAADGEAEAQQRF